MSQAAFEPLYVETLSVVGGRPVRLVWHYEQALEIALLEMALELIHGREAAR